MLEVVRRATRTLPYTLRAKEWEANPALGESARGFCL
jgi:hypothetical protein